MSLSLIFALVGGAFGAWRAKQRGGKTADLLQWGVVHGILMGLIGLLIAIMLVRMLG